MSAVQVVRWADCRRMPWKNGGGETVEILVSPEGTGFDAFDWRLSSALVAAAGPFSALPGIDRTLCVTSPGTLSLVIDGVAIPLDQDSPPQSFRGEAPVSGALPDGPVRDLNVMTRRGRMNQRVQNLRILGARTIAAGADLTLLFLADGTLDVIAAGLQAPLRLSTGDTLRLDGVPTVDVSADTEVRLVVARLSPAGPEPARHGVESASP